MVTTHNDGLVTGSRHDLETLRREAAHLTREADRAEHAYERLAWISYATIFLAIPFVVVTFRLHMQAWHYFVAFGLFLAGALLIDGLNIAGFAKRHKADDAVRRAQDAEAVQPVAAPR